MLRRFTSALTIGFLSLATASLSGCAAEASKSAVSAVQSAEQEASKQPATPVEPADGKSYSNADFAALTKNPEVILLDVRTPEEYAQGHLPHARNLNVTDSEAFSAGIAKLEPNKWYGFYCRSGNRSKTAMQIARSQGLKVFELADGISGWDGPVER